jgi:putative ABC transport system permease protein
MMPFSEILSMAFQNIRANILRSILTLLIIAFGIMALVGILTAIDAIAFSLNDNFSGLGANSFSIERKWNEGRGRHQGRQEKPADPIDYKQAIGFKERFEFDAKVAVGMYGTGQATVKFNEKKTNPNVIFNGIDENFLDVKGLDVQYGRNFTKSEVDAGTPNAIIGTEIVKTLFDGKADMALGQIISVDNHKYRVIGILATKGSTMNESSDRKVYGTLTNVRSVFGGSDDRDFFLMVAVNNATDLTAAQSEATGLFRQLRGLRPGQDDDFELNSSDSLIGILKENTTNLRLATIAIGLMTLLSAAIGLMNIMLVSVTERTREIGIYKALGATSRSILMQFLIEAIVICQIGGIVGIILGILIGNIVTPILGGSFLIPWAWMFLGFTLCMIVGVVSGFYPALKAAKLDPIESLRYE